jgi:phosphoserine phosphatase
MTISTDFETATAQINDPLPSWNEGLAKQAIIEFVQATTDKSSPNYVESCDRIATFDQDGTLWVEHPFYSQAMFALDRLKSLAPQHPEWQNQEPFKSILEGNQDAIAKLTEGDLVQIVAATHAGMTTEEFIKIARDWQITAKHPRFQKLYTELVYQPMREVLQYLQANGFKTYIVTGGGQEFVRIYSDRVYDVPIERVIGSSIVTKYDHQDGKPVLMREPKVFFINDHAGKTTGINLFIGKRPIAAFGNSDGDRQMLEYTQAGKGMRLSMLVLHDDEKREYAYGPAQGLPNTKVGRFTQALYDQSQENGWIVVSMKNDWKRIFSF